MTNFVETEKSLDPVTFEVLKNSFITTVDQMAEQMLRTCYSFVIYNRDFSNALHDADGNSVAQGNYDIAVHVGTLHNTCKEVIRVFEGDMAPGDVYAINDPYAGGTHFSDVRLVRPIFDEDTLIGFSQSNGHWSDLGGSVPGSFDVTARDMFREGMRITPVRLFRAGRFCSDVANLIAANTRDPASIIGDIHSQAQATQVAERELLRLVKKYGRDTVVRGMEEVQDYVERAVRKRLAELPDGTWESVDYIDRDLGGGEGMIPIHIKMTIKGDTIHYDFTGSHKTIGSMYNSAPGATFSAVVAGMKTFFPDLPLNSGFYRMIEVTAPKNSVVSAEWPVAVTGFLMPFEKIMNSIFEMWSQIMPERAIACAFNLEYLLAGGRDARKPEKPIFMFYEWLPGGWGGRNGKDGADVTTACFGTGLMSQPNEGNERVNPTRTTEFQIKQDSAGPGKWRGGVGVQKTSVLLAAEDAVMSYICDRERAVVWGVEGGLPSMPHGLTIRRAGEEVDTWLGSVFSDYPVFTGDQFARPTAGGGGFGDPLERDPLHVLEDVIDDYVSIERAKVDYGVVLKVIDRDLCEYEIDLPATEAARTEIRDNRKQWARSDPAMVSARYKSGEIDAMDAVRRFAVILDWESGNVLENTTRQFRESFERRSVAHWK
ncbi:MULTISPECIES: hydantoinase B/oxoprolinase family protein [unclassified Rhizobium]|uniref:hydantoinase B/oxoprolinase family protein n=1 Tax=unclassified Rhizobium TaxID=2613769 RepID=UPI001ADD0A24|nr:MULTISPECIES: hydantoinase B/oxoprolinase family protein [unclassified Rhizobium]MBO9100623.1 hydantoinase B/oxoprolinase family protein [Rhizobium sp. L58/93]MBO9136015.1 hydantoinase B/oxoprolinase family protein [Rhizobium sp. B209b/85]MBO9171327.1 hydantoinase B/oxoprolinase family protein [Rhizobium sp. L245/93]MBO9187194.1 hydantoinase B/oxoprolinase family protein [Rhizobium sp. E27B/91]QXZ87880.1 hydantoinase B/oxoprolinase family protein [Rhizobium sp. K1/93]